MAFRHLVTRCLLGILLMSALSHPICFASHSSGQLWFTFLSQGKVTNNLRLWVELQPRYHLSDERFSTLLVRSALGWEMNPNLVLWIGHAWTPQFYPSARSENRLWSQAILSTGFSGFTLLQRLRIESRFVENLPEAAFRFRYLSRALIPIGNTSFSAAIYDELFFALNEVSPVIASGFDQNRFFAGINYRHSSAISSEFGYMWNAINAPGSQPNLSNHVINLAIYYFFDLTSGD